MAGRHHAHAEWVLRESNTGALLSWDDVNRALLMDIRDHLRAIRGIFECYNAQRIPRILDNIARNTEKPKRKPRQDKKEEKS